MPVSLEITLGLPENEKVHRAMGSVLQGALMEMLDAESADKLHEDGLRPYSQYVYFNRDIQLPIWCINALNDWAYEKILIPLMNQKEIFLKHKKYYVKFLEYNVIVEDSYKDMLDYFMSMSNGQISQNVDINFITTASFRRDGKYVIFPELYLIIQSLLNRWNAFSDSFIIEEENLSHILATFCQIKEYNLYTQIFLLEHQRINGFCGSMRLHFEGNENVNNLLKLLFHYANYSGIGIKTALGMGAIKTKLK